MSSASVQVRVPPKPPAEHERETDGKELAPVSMMLPPKVTLSTILISYRITHLLILRAHLLPQSRGAGRPCWLHLLHLDCTSCENYGPEELTST